MKAQTIFQVLLVAAAVGVPGFLPFDQTGLTRDFGLYNAQSLSRIALYVTICYMFLLVLALSKIQQIMKNTEILFPVYPEDFRSLFLLYGVFLLSLFNAGGITDFSLGLYRICEWILAVGLCAVALESPDNALSERHTGSDTFFRLLKYITTIPVVIVFIGVVVVPEMAVGKSGDHFRLGGYLYHPNSLGLLTGIGTVVFWFHSPGLKSRIWAVVLLVTMVLTYSRGAIIGFLVAIAAIYLVHKKVPTKLLAWTAVPALLLVVLAFERVIYDEILALLMRSANMEDVATINNRTAVWAAAWQAILDSPLIGHGFVFGPKHLGNYVGQSWWSAPHAHNDILNAGLAGGIGAAILTAVIYVRLGYGVITTDWPGAERATIIAVYVQLTLHSMLTPVLSSEVHFQGIILLLLMCYLAVTVQKRTRIEEVHWELKNARPFSS